ncbi:hypothetical protein LUZ60_003932 [Juncus effusus]|nr:hypothetical protein LUZ60_003932 [Juncus effusus]
MALESLTFAHGDLAMDGLSSSSIWNHHQDFFPQNTDELKQRLIRSTWELETLKSNASEELRKKDETINKLITIIKITTKERDEANEQLNTFLSLLQSKNPQQTGCVNSGLTESDSLSDSQTRTNTTDVESFHQADSCNITNTTTIVSAPAVKYDHGSLIIDELAKKRVLPETGKLLQAVMSAGPLLQTLMVAGPLPTWRNPPPGFQIPTFSTKGINAINSFNLANESGFCAKRARYE